MKRLVCIAALLVSACASGPSPNFYNGRYYYAGDSSCKRMTDLGDGRIMCHDKKGNQTGWRSAMTAQDIQIYQIRQAQHAQEMADLSRQIDETGKSVTGNLNALTQQYQSYTPPAVEPIGQPRRTVTCVKAGIVTQCRY